MSSFDAELYLRLVGERQLLSREVSHHPHDSSSLDEAAAALVVAHQIDIETALVVIADYDRAIGARSGPWHGGRRRVITQGAGPTAASAAALGPRQAFEVDRRIEQPWGQLTVRYITLSPEAVTVGVTLRWNADHVETMHHHGHLGIAEEMSLTDDRGTTVTAHFGGDGGDVEWRGQFRSDSPLAMDTAWVELEGERIELTQALSSPEVRIEDLPSQPPAWRHLWHRLSVGESFRGANIAPAIDALIAAGAVGADDPQLEQVRAVAEQFGPGPMRMRAHGPGSGQTTGLPEPWASAGRYTGEGRRGPIVVGAATPIFDAISVAVDAIDAQAESFEARVAIAPGLMTRRQRWGGLPIDELAWWAADDRGNHYLGGLNAWSGGDQRDEGTVEFAGGIDRKARWLDVMPTTTAKRALIRIPLTAEDDA